MNENRFWTPIEDAWTAKPVNAAFRAELLATIDAPAKREAFVDRHFDKDDLGMIPEEDAFIDTLTADLVELSKEELIAFDRLLERKLYAIDREEVQAVTDGSDDGFLYCRGFVVACGKAFYEAVDRDPENALCDFECEAMCYLPHEVYQERFGGDPPDSEISRESCSNADAWPSL